MDVTSLVAGLLVGFFLIGAVAGWVAGLLKHGGTSLFRNIGIGIIGAFVGGFLFGLAPVSVEIGLIGAPISAALGAAIVLFAVRVKKQPESE